MLDDERTMIWLARVAFGGLIRGLAALGGAITAYGATGMFTSAGLMPPNVIVYAGFVVCACAAIMLWSTERRMSGLWPALLAFGLPFSLYAVPSFGVEECAAPYQPITSVYSCAVVGSHVLAVIAPLVTMLALVLAVLDMHAISRSRRTVARP